MDNLLEETKLLDYSKPAICALIDKRGWWGLSKKDRILGIYNFVRDEIAFGYNISDNVAGS